MSAPRYILNIERTKLLLPANVSATTALTILTAFETARIVDDIYVPELKPEGICSVDFVRDRAPEISVQLTGREFVTEAEATDMRKKDAELRKQKTAGETAAA